MAPRAGKKPAKPKKAPKAKKPLRVQLPAVIPPPPPPPPILDSLGRPSTYRPEYAEAARILCEAGATNQQIADELDISITTFYHWRNVHPDFAEKIKLGKIPADNAIERTAYELAHGYWMEIQKAIKLTDNLGNERVEVVTLKEWVPPDPKMVQWWLQNRKGDFWKSKTENTTTVSVRHEVTSLEQARDLVKAKLIELKRQADGSFGVTTLQPEQ